MIYLGMDAVNAGLLISKSSYGKSNSGVGTSGNNILQVTSLAQNNSTGDKVTISAAGKTAAELEVEKYGLPKWVNSYIAPLNDLSSALAMKPGNQWGEQRAALKTELKQYGEYFSNAYQAAIKSTGATDGPSYHAMVANDPSVGDRAGAVFKETLMSMPGMKSLMSRLSVPAANES